jgi:hypothetical protein
MKEIKKIHCSVFLLFFYLSSVHAQKFSFSIEPHVSTGYYFPSKIKVLEGKNFLNSSITHTPLIPFSIGRGVYSNGSKALTLNNNGGHGLDLGLNFKKNDSIYNWTLCAGIYEQKMNYKFKFSSDSVVNETFWLQNKTLQYRLGVRKYFNNEYIQNVFVQFNFIYAYNPKLREPGWIPLTGTNSFNYRVQNGGHLNYHNHDVVGSNSLVEVEWGELSGTRLEWSLSAIIPLLSNRLYKTDFTYTSFFHSLNNGKIQTTQKAGGVFFNLRYNFEFPNPEERSREQKNKHVVPAYLPKERVKNVQRTYTTSSMSVILEIFDNASMDGDSVSVDVNSIRVLDHYGIVQEPKQLVIQLMQGLNEITFYAENLGITPPNTAMIHLIDGDTRKTFVINSDFGQSGTIHIYKE